MIFRQIRVKMVLKI